MGLVGSKACMRRDVLVVSGGRPNAPKLVQPHEVHDVNAVSDERLNAPNLVQRHDVLVVSGELPDASKLVQLQADIVASVKEHAFLDCSRLSFVKHTAQSLVQLVYDGLRGNNRHINRLLLGRKAVGKAFLLGALVAAAGKHLSAHRLVCVTLTFTETVLETTSLVDKLARLLGATALPPRPGIAGPQQIRGPTAEFLDWLEAKNIYLFCVVVEFQSVFTAACKHGAHIIRELQAFGDSTRGRIVWVLSGSGGDLMKLATGKWEGGTSKYANYEALDLNVTKFVPARIHPFLSADDFRGLVDFGRISKKSGGKLLPPLWKMYLLTGGLPGATRTCLQIGCASENTISDKEFSALAIGDRDGEVLKAILKVLDAAFGIAPHPPSSSDNALKGVAQASEKGNSTADEAAASLVPPQGAESPDEEGLAACARWTEWVSLAYVIEVARREFGVSDLETKAACYDLADRGIVRFNHRAMRVSLGSPRVLLDALVDHAHVTVKEVIALRTRNQDDAQETELAEDVAMRLIAVQSWRSSLAVAQAQHSLSPFGFSTKVSSSTDAGRPDKLRLGAGATYNVAQVVNRMWREGDRDALGADGVVLAQSVDGLVAHRIQVKVRSGRLLSTTEAANRPNSPRGDSVQDIIARFKSLSSNAADQYRSAGLALAKQRLILATTQDVTPEAKRVLEEAQVTLWDKRWLAQHVWPDTVRRLDPKVFG